MASNFRIMTDRRSDCLHLKLAGDFDGSSACELINMITNDHGKASRIFIHCESLKKIYPFGRNILLIEIGTLGKELPALFFTGTKAVLIAPEGNVVH